MAEKNSDGNIIYNAVSSFGEAYAGGVKKFTVHVLKKPAVFVHRSIKRFLNFIFRSFIIIFAPLGADEEEFIKDAKKGFRQSVKTLFTHPMSFFPVVSYYIKKAFSCYNYGLKNFMIWLLPAVSAAGLIICINVLSAKSVALKIDAGGETLGFVAEESDFISARDAAAKVLGKNSSSDLPEITYSLTLININEFTDSDTIRNRLIEKSASDLVSACGVYIDGDFFAAVYNESDAKNVLDGVLDEKKKDEKNYLVSFCQKIEYRQGLYPESSVITSSQFREKLLSPGDEGGIYTASEGDTLEKIAAKEKADIKKLMFLNPGYKEKTEIEEGTEIILRSSEILQIKEIKSRVSTEALDFPVQEFQSEALYSGSKRILSKGKKGYAQVTDLVTYINGDIKDEKEFSRLTLKDPVAQRVQIGIKPLDSEYSHSRGGILLWPVIGAYAVNSPFGYRWGKIHKGIDIGVGDAPGTSLGKTIVAVASGTVVAAGIYPSYGYFVKIDHGNGMQTAYGHCLENSLLVVPGQQVVAGQPIARVGQTGYATGPHLHFEVRINGNKVDPAPYLGI